MNSGLHSRRRAFVELWIAGALWGFGFVATRWALESFAPFTLVAFRFLFVAAGGGLLVLSSARLRTSIRRGDIWHCVLPGLFLSLTLTLQTVGLEQTSIARAGFLSALYVVWIPFFDRHAPIPWTHWCCVLLALVGTALMCRVGLEARINTGDLFVFACSIAAMLHIFSVGRALKKIPSTFSLNFFQSLWAGVFALPFVFSWEIGDQRPWTILGWTGIAILAYASTLIAFAIQVRAQRVLRASTVSLFFLLESPFAALFGWMFFTETMSPIQWLGACLILMAAIATLKTVSFEPTHSA